MILLLNIVLTPSDGRIIKGKYEMYVYKNEFYISSLILLINLKWGFKCDLFNCISVSNVLIINYKMSRHN